MVARARARACVWLAIDPAPGGPHARRDGMARTKRGSSRTRSAWSSGLALLLVRDRKRLAPLVRPDAEVRRKVAPAVGVLHRLDGDEGLQPGLGPEAEVFRLAAAA